MSKALIINGSPHEHGCTYTALHEVEMKLNEHQIETELLYLGTKLSRTVSAVASASILAAAVLRTK